MKDVNELILKLKIELSKKDKSEGFNLAIESIASFYMENYNLTKNEVAILLTNKEKTMLSFAHPPYLVNSGMIPTNLGESIASRVYSTGRGFMDNNLQQQRHLFIFESIKTPENRIIPIWKMISAKIGFEGVPLGVVEISKRSEKFQDAGPDFTFEDLQFLEESIKKVSPLLKGVMPENFLGLVR